MPDQRLADTRHRWTLRWLADLRQDLRFALRQLAQSPGSALLVIGALAVGIGANAVMAGVIDRLLLRPPAHVGDPSRVARLVLVGPNPGGGTFAGTSSNYPTLLDLEREVSSFEAVAGAATFQLSLGRGRDAVEIRTSLVSPNYFTLLRPDPAIGRVFAESDGFPAGEGLGGPAFAVLSHGFWQRQFGGDQAVIGREIRIGSALYTIVGVMPAGFKGLDVASPDVWLPISVTGPAEAPALWFAGRGSTWVALIARLKPGVSPRVAEQEATAVWRQYNAPAGTRDTLMRVVAAPAIRGNGPDAPRAAKVTVWLGGVSVLVVIIACANVASVLLGRAFTRRGETAIRLALGATRGRLTRHMLAEGGLLAVLGGVMALGVVAVATNVFAYVLADDVAAGSGDRFLDARVLVWTAVVSLGTAIAVSMAPLAQSVSPHPVDALRAAPLTGGGRVSRARTLLLSTQAALCTLLSIGAVLFAMSLRRVEALDLGLDVDHTLIARFDLDGLALRVPETDAIYADMLARVRAIPDVERAALAEKDPYRSGRAVSAHTPTRSADELWHANVSEIPMEAAVDSGFFRTVGATTLRGRDFESTDRAGAPRVAIINEPLARLLWPAEDALGKCVILPARAGEKNGACVTVVGVLPGFWRRTILNRELLLVYVPLAQRTVRFGRPGGLFIRARGDPAAITPAVREAIQSVRADLPAVSVTPIRDVIDLEVKPWRLAAMTFGLFGALALAMALVGLYGIIAFAVAHRSSEIAIRIALGARRRDVLAVVGGDALQAVGAGIAIGAVAALLASPRVGPLLFQTSPHDVRVVAGVAALLLLIAVAGAFLPTIRLLGRSPAALLRSS